MTAKLDIDLQKEVDAHAGQPIRVEHPGTQAVYFIIDEETHRRAMRALQEQEDSDAITAGIEAMEAGRTIPLAEADKQIREELGFQPREQ